MKQKKIIYINLFFLTKKQKGGVYRFAWNMLVALDRQIALLNLVNNLKFIGILPRVQGVDFPELHNIQIEQVSSIKSHHLWEQLVLPFITRGQFLINLCNFAPLFKTNQLCVIHDALVFRYPESYSKKTVFISKIFYKLIIRNSAQIATVSNFSKSEITTCMGKPKNEIIVLGNSAENFTHYRSDTSVLDKNSLQKDQYILCVFSQQNSFYKNVDRFIRAIDSVRFKFVIVGNVELADLAENKNILNIGFVSNEQLKALYENAYFFIMPSLYEGFGIPLLEAMGCGCPVVCSDIPVFKEVASAAAVYFDPQNEKSITEAIKHTISELKAPQDLINLGYKQADNYNWNNIALKLMSNIDRLEKL